MEKEGGVERAGIDKDWQGRTGTGRYWYGQIGGLGRFIGGGGSEVRWSGGMRMVLVF